MTGGDNEFGQCVAESNVNTGSGNWWMAAAECPVGRSETVHVVYVVIGVIVGRRTT